MFIVFEAQGGSLLTAFSFIPTLTLSIPSILNRLISLYRLVYTPLLLILSITYSIVYYYSYTTRIFPLLLVTSRLSCPIVTLRVRLRVLT